ncbi:MAG: hypothetical protein HC765_03740 [Brachymonas sp.]|nr:hypothetical protein [Brachymonas sp.]
MKAWIVLVSAMWMAGAQAQTLNGVKVEPANAKVGEAVKITAMFDPTDNVNCGIRLRFGDGTESLVRLNKANEIPHVVSRSYAKAGQFKIEANPVKVGGSFKCAGKTQSTMLTVAAPAPVAAAPASAPTAAAKTPEANKPALCPEGWTWPKPDKTPKPKPLTVVPKQVPKCQSPNSAAPVI